MNMAKKVSKEIIIEKCLSFSIFAIFLFLPWYHNYSGKIQPVDLPILFTLFLFIINKRFFNFHYLTISRNYCICFALIGYTIMRYGFAYFHNNLVLHDLLANFYYLILLTLFIDILLYLYQTCSLQLFYETIISCLLIAPILPLGILIVFGPNYGLAKLQLVEPTIVRPILTFNNANQLGFFALINLSIFFYLNLFVQNTDVKINKVFSLIIINVNLLLLILSVSRAATPAFLLYLLSYGFIFKFNLTKKNRLTWLIIISCLAFLGVIYIQHHLLLLKTNNTTAINQSFIYDFYDRAIKGINYNFNNIYLFLFGCASQTNPLRPDGLEFHNNFLGIFNEIGLIGLSIYSALILSLFFELWKKGFYYLFPFICYLLYSEMHYAFRTRINWLFFGMLIFIMAYKEATNQRSIQHDQSIGNTKLYN